MCHSHILTYWRLARTRTMRARFHPFCRWSKSRRHSRWWPWRLSSCTYCRGDRNRERKTGKNPALACDEELFSRGYVYIQEIHATSYFLFDWLLIMAWNYYCTSSPWGFRKQSSLSPSGILDSTTQYLLTRHQHNLRATKQVVHMSHRSWIWSILGTREKPIHVYCQGWGIKRFLWLFEASCAWTNYLYSLYFWSDDC